MPPPTGSARAFVFVARRAQPRRVNPLSDAPTNGGSARAFVFVARWAQPRRVNPLSDAPTNGGSARAFVFVARRAQPRRAEPSPNLGERSWRVTSGFGTAQPCPGDCKFRSDTEGVVEGSRGCEPNQIRRAHRTPHPRNALSPKSHPERVPDQGLAMMQPTVLLRQSCDDDRVGSRSTPSTRSDTLSGCAVWGATPSGGARSASTSALLRTRTPGYHL